MVPPQASGEAAAGRAERSQLELRVGELSARLAQREARLDELQALVRSADLETPQKAASLAMDMVGRLVSDLVTSGAAGFVWVVLCLIVLYSAGGVVVVWCGVVCVCL